MRNKWQLLRAVEESREPLGLKSTSIAVLRALVSFIRYDELSGDQDARHICFASNAALAGRAHVSVQTVERHVAKLVSLGLVTRRSSGNGKRWARRNGAGEVVMATGLSLLPLVQRNAEFVGLAQSHEQALRALRLLRDRCAAALAKLSEVCPTAPALEALKARAQRLFRRKPCGAALDDLLDDITSEVARLTPQDTAELRGNDPEIEGHKETNLIPEVKEQSDLKINVTPDQMQRSFPRLCAELRFARSAEACERMMRATADDLGLEPVWVELDALGPTLKFMALGYILERVETLKQPRAYGWYLVKGLRSGSLNWQSLLQKPVRDIRKHPCKSSMRWHNCKV